MNADRWQVQRPAAAQTSGSRHSLRGLRVQIVLWTILPLTLVLVGVAFTGVYSHEQAMRTLVQDRDQALAAVSATQIQDLLREWVEPLQALAAEQAFHHPEPATQVALMRQFGDDMSAYRGGLAILDETGALLLAPGATPAWAKDGRIADLAREVMVRQNPVLSMSSAAAAKDATLLVGVPVQDETGTTYGVLASQFPIQSLGLEDLLGQVQVGDRGASYLVDGRGRMLAQQPPDRARQTLVGHTGLEVALQDHTPGATLCHAPDGERMTLAYAAVDYGGLGWRVLIEQPWADVVGPVLRYSQFVPLVMVLALIVSLLALYYGVRSIVRPLQLLGQQAERVAWGDFEATGTPVGGVGEIEDLRRTLAQMAQRIQAYQRGMHDYIAAMTAGQEEERRRLARELHDDTVQALIALNHQVERAQKLLAKEPDRVAERLVELRAALTETIQDVRRFSRDLRPIYLEDLGFIPALEMLARDADRSEDLAVRFSLKGRVRRLPADLELAVFRIVQEALNNVLQHARAQVAQVTVRFGPRELSLLVQDDGAGFHVPELPDLLAQRGHFGLMGIQERVLLYGGKLSMRSRPGGGTEISVRLPYPDTEIDRMPGR